jgi:hypothetical protein
MREPLKPYKGEDRLNYLCLVMTELLGETSLARLPMLVSGFDSVLRTLPPAAQQALLNIRYSGLAPVTRRELDLMVDRYRERHERQERARRRGDPLPGGALPQRYEISEDLQLRKTWSLLVPDDVQEALVGLTSPLAVRPRASPPVANPATSAEAVRGEFGAFVPPLGFAPREPPTYDLKANDSPAGQVAWADLVDLAIEFDQIDVAKGRQAPGSNRWFRRLHDARGEPTARLLGATADGLRPAAGIELSGLKHLIGLPGAGKTTLLYLLAAYMAKRDIAACFLLPSIEMASTFIETLAAYGIDVALLSGQSENTKRRHVMNFSRSLARENAGYGVTRPIAPAFATNCALAGFTEDTDEFPHDSPPCQTIMQRRSGRSRSMRHRCALSSVCGLQQSERHLAETKLWAGHVLSVDRAVSGLYSEHDLRHFEFIARTFDVLVIDECDLAQRNLDERGTPVMTLVGEANSLWSLLLRDLHQPVAGGRNAFVSGELGGALMEMTGRFGRAAERLFSRITRLPPKILDDNKNTLLTSLSLLTDMFDEEGDEAIRQRRGGLERLWDEAAKSVAFRNRKDAEDDHGDDEEAQDLSAAQTQIAQALQCSVDEAKAAYEQLMAAVAAFDVNGDDAAVEAIAQALRSVPGLRPTLDGPALHAYAGLLVCVTLVVMQHFGLAPHLRLMHQDGVVGDDVFVSQPSRDQLRLLPESLIGRLSGVRYTVSEDGDVEISHVSFASTPRLLAHRMHRLRTEVDGGELAVLFTSATSLIEASPSFHVDVGPHYVLARPNSGDGWRDSRYRFKCKRDPRDGKPLRFSGSRLADREYILKAMVGELLKDGAYGDVATAIQTNDARADGITRKAGFVVNSYEQCELLYHYIHNSHSFWRGKVRYLAKASERGAMGMQHAVTAADVEQLGFDSGWEILIFPMSAIGRGVNIVFPSGPRANQAMIGSLYLLTRPHPRGDSLQLIQGLVGSTSARFDQTRFDSTGQALSVLRAERREIASTAEYLLRMSLVSQRLGRYAKPFVADQIVQVLQTIGRAMRGDCPAFVYFVDAAWAPMSAQGQPDTARTSMLVMMQDILAECLNHPEPSRRDCYRHLYESFSVPLGQIENLIREESR